MSAAGKYIDLIGTTLTKLKIGIGGVLLKNSSANLVIRNTTDSADAELTASKINVSGDAIVLNSDSAGSGTDWKITLQRPSSGMTADYTLTLPPDDGTPGQIPATNGAGVLSWVNAGSTAACIKYDSTDVAFGASSPITMFNTGAADIIVEIMVYVDTAFNGATPTLTVGITGTTSKYSNTTSCDLKSEGSYEINPNLPAAGVESLICTFVSSGSTVGVARVVVGYATPS